MYMIWLIQSTHSYDARAFAYTSWYTFVKKKQELGEMMDGNGVVLIDSKAPEQSSEWLMNWQVAWCLKSVTWATVLITAM